MPRFVSHWLYPSDKSLISCNKDFCVKLIQPELSLSCVLRCPCLLSSDAVVGVVQAILLAHALSRVAVNWAFCLLHSSCKKMHAKYIERSFKYNLVKMSLKDCHKFLLPLELQISVPLGQPWANQTEVLSEKRNKKVLMQSFLLIEISVTSLQAGLNIWGVHVLLPQTPPQQITLLAKLVFHWCVT